MKKKMNRRTFLKYSAAVGATAAISGVPTLLRAQAPEIKIASIQPVTGVISDIGISMRRANQMAVDDINAKGGIKSNGRSKIETLTGRYRSKRRGGPYRGRAGDQRRGGLSGRSISQR